MTKCTFTRSRFSPGMRRFHSREFGNEKSLGIPGARETGAREWKLYTRVTAEPYDTLQECLYVDRCNVRERV